VITHASDLAEFASDAAFAIDVDGKIKAWNAQAQRLLGHTPAEVIGQHCGMVLQATMSGGEPLCQRSNIAMRLEGNRQFWTDVQESSSSGPASSCVVNGRSGSSGNVGSG
jgi:PAS domain S-box-containing protein